MTGRTTCAGYSNNAANNNKNLLLNAKCFHQKLWFWKPAPLFEPTPFPLQFPQFYVAGGPFFCACRLCFESRVSSSWATSTTPENACSMSFRTRKSRVSFRVLSLSL